MKKNFIKLLLVLRYTNDIITSLGAVAGAKIVVQYVHLDGMNFKVL